ncbi:MAG: 50S ribosome-binding GTPase [Planctomycetaceae bacterium]|nr:50S ribosome-binding GTPase [Planctomycetaceae bacterium]
MADLESRGCKPRPSFTVPSHGEGLIAKECREAVTRATTLRTADHLLQQLEVLPAAIDRLADLPADEQQLAIESLLRWADFGLHLTQPWRVVLCGRPNVGKSSLINAFVGYSRSIVFDQPGTTRDVVTVETALDGWPIEFADTAGLREDPDELETEGIERAQLRLVTADLRVVLIDVSQSPTDADRELLTAWGDGIIVAHKCDLDDAWGCETPPTAIRVSSVTKAGVDQLIATIVKRLVPQVCEPMTPVPISQRQIEVLQRALDGCRNGGNVINEIRPS